MTHIRPFERADLPAVGALQRLVAPGMPGAEVLERTVLDAPWADPKIPALVAEADTDPGGGDGAGAGGIIGFLGSHPRRMRVDGRPLRVACSGHLMAHPDHPGVGALLTRAYLRGPQDLTVTDGGTDLMAAIWTQLRGQTQTSASLAWYRVLRPASTVVGLLRRRRGGALQAAPAVHAADTPLTRVPGLAVGAVDTRGRELTVPLLAEQMPTIARRYRLHPDYDEPYLAWLFAELEAMANRDTRGDVVRELVSTPSGRVLGWYVYYLTPRGIADVLQIASPGGAIDRVFDHLVADAARRGAAAVRGRLEPALAAVTRSRRCRIRPTAWALVDTDDTAVLGLLASTAALMTRLDGEWWM